MTELESAMLALALSAVGAVVCLLIVLAVIAFSAIRQAEAVDAAEARTEGAIANWLVAEASKPGASDAAMNHFAWAAVAIKVGEYRATDA